MKRETKIHLYAKSNEMCFAFLLHGENVTAAFTLLAHDNRDVPPGGFYHVVNLLPADLGRHSRVRIFEHDTEMPKCDFLGGCSCFYDGSSLQAMDLWKKFRTTRDPEVIWTALEDTVREYEDLIARQGKPDPEADSSGKATETAEQQKASNQQ